MGSSESVGAGQHPHLVAQQAAVGRIVNVGLDHSGVNGVGQMPVTVVAPAIGNALARLTGVCAYAKRR